VSRAGLGVQLLPDHVTRRADVEGAAILTVIDGGAAAGAGLKGVTQTRDGRLRLGDVVVGINGRKVACVEDLCAELDRLQPGDTATLACRRDQETREVRLRLQEID
jgi:S1-C subfamily serine protease